MAGMPLGIPIKKGRAEARPVQSGRNLYLRNFIVLRAEISRNLSFLLSIREMRQDYGIMRNHETIKL
jgi:hypothetical protein